MGEGVGDSRGSMTQIKSTQVISSLHSFLISQNAGIYMLGWAQNLIKLRTW